MKRFKPFKPKSNVSKLKKERREQETDEIARLQSSYAGVDISEIKSFEDIPLSRRTKKGLTENDYLVPTEIQKESVLVAMQGIDVLGAAKTGSGKTLAFLIPMLEILFCKQWTKLDGVGAIIITPTRELALQIYQTLVKVGKHHDFSAGLIIGGKDVSFEKERLQYINIIICTPGRLLQHMDENPSFDCTNLQLLILDEADRCLDMGFERDMNAIIENIPKKRITLLFSATQTRKVKDLARLSLVDPKFISVHEHEKHKTPEGLTQSYIICSQHEKISILWSFIKTHPKQKIIIFFATCNQVKYIYDIMCHLRPYNTLYALMGKLKQEKRMEVYQAFCRKQHAVLFATDLASRGLDFPHVHWVIHADCPEDVESYIHRSGRTARYYKGGESLLFLNPSESIFIDKLADNRIPIDEIKINQAQLVSPQAKIESFLAKNPELKASAQRAFVSYAKSVYLMKDKHVFNIKKIDTDLYARSLGLVVSPRIRFIDKKEKAKLKNEDEKTNTTEASSSFNFFPDESDNEDDILTMKRKNHEIEDGDLPIKDEKEKPKENITKVKLAKRILKKKILPNKKIKFSEEGEIIVNQTKEKITEAGKIYEASEESGINIEEAKKVLLEEDRFDRKLYKEKLKARKWALKEKLKEKQDDAYRKEKVESDKEEEEEEEYESESGSEPDLSWLPDPDKVYSKDNEGSNVSDQEVSDDDKLTNSSDSDSGITIKEKEELALKLLNCKR